MKMNLLNLILMMFLATGCSLNLSLDKGAASGESLNPITLLKVVPFAGNYYTKDNTFDLQVSDLSVTQIQISNDGTCTAGTWQPLTNPQSWTVTSSGGSVQTVSVRVKKDSGVESGCFVYNIIKDDQTPTSASVSVTADVLSGGVEYVKNSSLQIAVTGLDALPLEMKIGTNSSCTDGIWEEFAPIKTFDSGLAHAGTLKVYAKFRDLVGNESACVSSNEVQRDSQGPAVSPSSLAVAGLPVTNPVEVFDQYINLSLSATDPLLEMMKISNNDNCSGGSYEAFSGTKTGWDIGLTTNQDVSVIFKDRLGNESSCVVLHLLHSSGGPSGTIAVQGAVSFSSKNFIAAAAGTLDLTYSNAADMKFFSDASCATAVGGWEAVSATKAWNFSVGEGSKEVGVQFRNAAGTQVSSCISTQVVLDTLPPTGPQVTPQTEYVASGIYYTKESSVDYVLSALDASLKDFEMVPGTSCGDGSAKQAFTANHTVAMPGADGAYNYSIQFFDVFSRASSCVTVKVVKDTTAGSAPSLAALYDNALGNLNETPRVFLKASSEVQDTSSRSGVSYYEMQIEKSGGVIEVPWKNLGATESFVISGLEANAALGKALHSGLKFVEGETYTLKLRSVDNVGHTSAVSSVSYTAKPAPVYLNPSENVATSQYQEQEFTARGVGDGTLLALSAGGKICKKPCDATAAMSSVTLEEGAVYKVALQSSATPATVVSSVVTIGQNAGTQSSSRWLVGTGDLCPTNYVLVPGDGEQRVGSFCVAKFEMKDVGGIAMSQAALTPWVNITRDDANAQCVATGGRLPTNEEWNTLAINISKQDANWEKSVDGDFLRLNRGVATGSSVYPVSDEAEHCSDFGTGCGTSWAINKRTHILSTGKIIWDFAGNVWEPTSSAFTEGIYNSSYMPVASLELPNIFNFYLAGGYDFRCYQPYNNEYCGMGRAWINNADVAGQVLYRGGSSNNNTDTGVFTSDFDYDATHSGPQHGFRCVRDIP